MQPTWLLRLGFIGEEFKTARLHLLKNLDGCIAWKTEEQKQAQIERLREEKNKTLEGVVDEEGHSVEIEETEDFEMTM